VSNQLPELKRRPGLSTWKVATQTQSQSVDNPDVKKRHGKKGKAAKEEAKDDANGEDGQEEQNAGEATKIQLGKKLVWHDSYESYDASVNALLGENSKPEDRKKTLPASCWPPANAAELNLEYW
jgi:hypothetical protein